MMKRHTVLNALTVLILLVASGLHIQHVMANKPSDPNNAAAGQAYVQAYVAFIHYVERLYKAAKHPAHGHFPEVAAGGAHK